MNKTVKINKILMAVLLSGIILFAGAGVMMSNSIALARAEGSGTTYYISSSTGNDAQAGTTEGTAWKTFANLQKKVLTAGDKVLLRRGDVWQDRLEIMGNGTEDAWVEIGDYGDKNLPKPTIRQSGGRDDIGVLVKDFYEDGGVVQKVNIRYIKIHDLQIEDTRMGIYVRVYATNNDGRNMHVDISDCVFNNIDSNDVMEELNKYVDDVEAANPQPPAYKENPIDSNYDSAIAEKIGTLIQDKINKLLAEEKGNLPILRGSTYMATGGGANEYIFPAAVFVGGKKDPVMSTKPETIDAANPALQYLSVNNCEMNECIAGVMCWFYAWNDTGGAQSWRQVLRYVKISDVMVTGAVNGGLAFECVDGGAVLTSDGKNMTANPEGWGEIRNFRVLAGSYEPYHTFPLGTTCAIFESTENFLITESEFSGMTNHGNADGCGFDFESDNKNIELSNSVMQNNEGGAILIMAHGGEYHENVFIRNNLMHSNLQHAIAAGDTNRMNNTEVAYIHVYNNGNKNVRIEDNVILMQESTRPGRSEAKFKIHAVGPKPATEGDGRVNYIWKNNYEAFYEGGSRVPYKSYFQGKVGAGGKIALDNLWLDGNVFRAMRITVKGAEQVRGTITATTLAGAKISESPAAFTAADGYVNIGALSGVQLKGVLKSAEIVLTGVQEGTDYTLEFVPDTQVVTKKISDREIGVTLTGDSKAVFSDDMTTDMFLLHGKLNKHNITKVKKTGLHSLTLTLDKDIVDGAYALTIKNDAYIAFFDKIFSGKGPDGAVSEGSWYYPISIKITTQPKKLNYETGEEIDLMGMKLTMTTADGEETSLSPAKCTIEGFDSSKGGKQTLTVRYRNAVTMFDIQVMKSEGSGSGDGSGSTGGRGCGSNLGAEIGGGAAILALVALACIVRRKVAKSKQ